MSSKISEKKHQGVKRLEMTEQKAIDLKKAMISFSQLIGFPHTTFVYTGNEQIPFNDTHPVYQTIMRHEFADAIRRSAKERKRILDLL